MLQIRNLRANIENIHREMQHLCDLHSSEKYDLAYLTISKNISSLKTRVEKLTQKHHGTPADMGTPSYRIFLWLRFLSATDHFGMHMLGLREYVDIITRLHKKNPLNSAQSHVKVDFSGYLYQRKTTQGTTQLLINEGFINAPMTIKEQLITAAFARRRGKAVSVIKAYAGSNDFLAMTKKVSGAPIANHLACKGRHFDLALIYRDLNGEYFDASLPQPRLTWSSSRAKRRLGYYHPDIHTIAVNRKLDKKSTPSLLVEYILYHEMLHQHFGIEHRNGRRYAHTTAFHQAEKRFKERQEAENLIKLLQ